MDAVGFIGAGGFGFEHGQTFERLRAGEIIDPYSGKVVGEDWGNPSILALSGAYLASQASTLGRDAVREPLTTTDQLILTDPLADVKVGDRIRQGGRSWSVSGFPAADINPFTGWQPTLVVNLEEPTG